MTIKSVLRLPLNNPERRLWILAVLISACLKSSPEPGAVPKPAFAEVSPDSVKVDELSPPSVSLRTPETPLRAPTISWAQRTLEEMALREKVAQMIMPWVLGNFAPEGTETHDRIVEVIEKEGVGGVIMSVGSPSEVAVKLNDLQEHSKYPLLVAADLETGAGFRFRGAVHIPTNIVLGGATTFPSLMAFGATGDPRYAYQLGRITALEARAMGVHIPFAPVLDVNNNTNNPIINIRSFGEDPQAVAEMGASFVRGLQDNGLVATGKHFPGHGDTEIDSHLELPVIRVPRERMEAIELVPFRAAIAAGIEGIMTAHIAVPELSGDDLPSTLSERILTDLLRSDLGFDGIIFTDAMDMGALARLYPQGEASVRAVQAGADVILMPRDVGQAIDALVRAVHSGSITESRIDTSVIKLLGLKEKFGLPERRTVPLDQIPRVVGVPQHTEIAQEIANRSITLLRNERNLLPLLGTRGARVMSVTFRNRNNILAGRYFDARLRETYPRLVQNQVDENTNAEAYQDLIRRAQRSNLVVVSVYSNFAGRVDLPDETVDFVNELARRRITHVVISFGNPYLIADFPDAQAYVLAWSSAQVSQQAAAVALFGGIEINGRSPTGMEPYFTLGDGIQIPKKTNTSGR